MRLSISKTQHTALLEAVCKQLGSDRPIDALEHILNCWLVGNIPASTVMPVVAIESAIPIEPEDEYSELMEF